MIGSISHNKYTTIPGDAVEVKEEGFDSVQYKLGHPSTVFKNIVVSKINHCQ